MKKKLALLLAATMIVGMMPFSAFAGSDNRANLNITGTKDEYNRKVGLVIENDDEDWNLSGGVLKFQLDLNGAEWGISDSTKATADELEKIFKSTTDGIRIDKKVAATGATSASYGTDAVSGIVVQKLTDSKITVQLTFGTDITGGTEIAKKITVPLPVKLTDDGEVSVSLDRLESPLSNGKYVFATVSSESTTTSVEGVRDVPESGKDLKAITIAENVKNSIQLGTIKLSLSSNFRFDTTETDKLVSVVDASGSIVASSINVNKDEDEVTITLTSAQGNNRSEKSKLVINGLYIVPEDKTSPNETATITVSGAGIDKTKLEVAKYVDYGYTWEAEDKDLPVIYSGTANADDNDSLKVLFKETVKASWLRERKTEITFPEGVKINNIDIKKKKNAAGIDGAITIDGNKATILGSKVGQDDKAEIEFIFNLSVEAGFVGDIEATIGGSGVTEEMSCVVAKAEMPFTVTTVKNEVKIDYRNVAVNDIIIKEAYAGALAKDSTLRIAAEEMAFEKDAKAEVTEGDLTLKKLETDKDGHIDIKIDRESVKDPATIKISNLQLYLNRSLPAGDYRLSAVPVSTDYKATGSEENKDEAFFKNYSKTIDSAMDKTETAKFFDTDEVILLPDFVKVVTAPRDQDDSTFTTKLSVVIGAKEMTVGDKVIPLPVPAYISAEGYTMLPVRAITEALSGSAIVNWDNATRKVTIIFGSRIISMTIGSNMMTINGTDVPMSAQAVITDEYTFLPLRDLGYALGLSSDKINWDASTKTATLN